VGNYKKTDFRLKECLAWRSSLPEQLKIAFRNNYAILLRLKPFKPRIIVFSAAGNYSHLKCLSITKKVHRLNTALSKEWDSTISRPLGCTTILFQISWDFRPPHLYLDLIFLIYILLAYKLKNVWSLVLAPLSVFVSHLLLGKKGTSLDGFTNELLF